MSARSVSTALATLTLAISCGVLLMTWADGTTSLELFGFALSGMVPSTALSFVLVALGILATPPLAGRAVPATAIALVVACVAVVDLAALAAGEVGGIEGLVAEDWRQGSMSFATAFQFLLASYCLAALASVRLQSDRAFSACATLGLLLSLVGVVGYAFDSRALTEIFIFSAMAPHTAVTAAMLHAALLAARPQASWIGLLFDVGTGSDAARRMLPFAVLGPFLLCLGTLALVRAEVFDPNFRLSLLTILLMTVSSLAVLRNAETVNHAERQARLDDLTALIKRDYFMQELERGVEGAAKDGTKVGLVLFDLDRFHSINQLLGDSVGDAVLRSVSERVAAEISGTDTLSRTGGDEFALMVCGRHSRDEIIAVAERIRAAVSGPVTVNGGAIDIGTSFGVTIFPDDATDTASLWRSCNLTLSTCKSYGRGSICFFDEKVAAAELKRSQLESELKGAIERDEMFLEFQPLFDIATRRMTCVEALVRWQHVREGLVPPVDFIQVAEESGAIRSLGQWVLRKACAQRAAWKARGLDFKVAVNVSPAETAYDDYPDFLARTLDAAGLDGDDIELEITEGALIDYEIPSVRSFFRVCESRGIGLVIDDFGTGYSSLSYLRRVPVSKIKIDRSFVWQIEHAEGEKLVEAMVRVGKSLDKRIVAEGIENAAQVEALRRIGCHDVQGYYFSPPLRAEAIAV
ncbi:putative bifunctional diguanylate cyclase/phosphodiesterase [Roseitranquillus sediminis]|uniref:putative bifunctional diguanylate cyclase/phosphodiesterase n=1 Tax=Roseitranquillus sediminis TaxID=2809051 RepID=UPI001D0C107A|nr:bifunctional diguanylate cyclase/phosphodiesterase [Roseitranquillus sediminis]MBM9595573.1 bifunctional diguanylate cyclase/phosphodiesterase [Roseitranquillus sediminis]